MGYILIIAILFYCVHKSHNSYSTYVTKDIKVRHITNKEASELNQYVYVKLGLIVLLLMVCLYLIFKK